MPIVEAVGSFIGIAVVSSMVARKIRAKKQQEKMNNLAHELWTRRGFTYGSPEVTPTSLNDSQAVTQINYHPTISATITPRIIAPPMHLYQDRLHTLHSSSTPITTLPNLGCDVTQYTDHSSKELNESIEWSVRNLPTPPNCILRQEIPSAPIISIADTTERVCLRAPILTSSQQEPSAPILEDIESNDGSTSAPPNSPNNNTPNVSRNSIQMVLDPLDIRVESEEQRIEPLEDRSSMESFYSCSSTLLDYESQELASIPPVA